jgi:hypothetical protein
VVVDRYDILVADEAPAGDYALYMGMYQPGDGWRMPAEDGACRRRPNDMIAPVTVSVVAE